MWNYKNKLVIYIKIIQMSLETKQKKNSFLSKTPFMVKINRNPNFWVEKGALKDVGSAGFDEAEWIFIIVEPLSIKGLIFATYIVSHFILFFFIYTILRVVLKVQMVKIIT